jgi:hypothetical protein
MDPATVSRLGQAVLAEAHALERAMGEAVDNVQGPGITESIDAHPGEAVTG